MSAYREQVATAIEALRITSATRYTWFDEPSAATAAAGGRSPSAQASRDYLRYRLTQTLYDDFYVRGAATPRAVVPQGPAVVGRTPLAMELAAANSGHGFWDGGWRVEGRGGEEVAVVKDGLRLSAPEGRVRAEQDGGVSLLLPPGSFGLSPGFYVAFGDTPFVERGPPSTVVRVYLHLTPAGAVRFTVAATSLLNRQGVAFRLKALNQPQRYTRNDCVVLYLQGRDFGRAHAALQELLPAMSGDLLPGTPALTKVLAPGIALAESPASGDSFGQDRCGLIAEGLVQAFELRLTATAARLEAVEEQFSRRGMSLERPYLNAGSEDAYPALIPPDRTPRAGASRPAPSAAAGHDFLEAAVRIGRETCDTAVWYEGRCSWMGLVPDASGALVHAALGPDLYLGSSGIALFLAELAGATGEVGARRTALGAARQALTLAERLPPEGRLGLFTGWTGIALSAYRVGALLGEDGLVEEARNLARKVASATPLPQEHDVIAGAAGAIIGLVVLSRALDEPSLAEAACALAEALLRGANRGHGTCSWPGPGRHRDLCGMSHGAAGIGLALAELAAAVKEPRFEQAARAAFAYERRWFDSEAGNWPDFRRTWKRGPAKKAAFACTWCHGAPGIALSRLRAWELSGDAQCEAEARLALQTTKRSVQLLLAVPRANYSLCHGIAGNCEVLLQGARVLGASTADDRRLVETAANLGIERYMAGGASSWPWDEGNGGGPGLMTGTAGIGRFYLRLAHAELPSVLLPRAEDWVL